MNEITESIPHSTSFLTVGLPLKISLVLNGQKVMYGSMLLGWRETAWLICEWPSQLGHAAGIAAGTPCTVRYLHDLRLNL